MIELARLRYIVPFTFGMQEKDFTEICAHIDALQAKGRPEWKRETEFKGEQDLFEHCLQDVFVGESENNMGASWKYVNYLHSKAIDVLLYTKPETGEEVRIPVLNAGLYLFQTGVGFFWYEIEPIGPDGAELTTDELVVFQEKFKELNRLYHRSKGFITVWESGAIKNTSDYVLRLQKEKERMQQLGVELHRASEERAEEIQKEIETFTKRSQEKHKKFDGVEFTMGNWIVRLLEPLNLTLRFLPERKNIALYPFAPTVPDKALLFNYVVANGEQEERLALQYRLCSGYGSSYEMPEDMAERIFRPFSNVSWYSVKEGCGCMVSVNEENRAFFTDGMKEKVMGNYFHMYILLLHQSYSLLHFSEKIAAGMPANAKNYTENRGDIQEKLVELETEINTFLVKTVYTSVSFIEHHNGFYNYVKDRLRIDEDINSLTVGLHSLEELMEMKREEEKSAEADKVNAGLGILSLLVIFSAVWDLVSLVEATIAGEVSFPSWILTGIVVALFVMAMIYVLPGMWQGLKNAGARKKKEKPVK